MQVPRFSVFGEEYTYVEQNVFLLSDMTFSFCLAFVASSCGAADMPEEWPKQMTEHRLRLGTSPPLPVRRGGEG